MSPPVRIHGLVHDYGTGPVLTIGDRSLDGGRVHLAGPNGAGKTTLLSILATLVTPTEGHVEVAGHRHPGQGLDVRRRIGYAGHDPSLHDELEAQTALAMHARLHAVEPARVDEALDAWGLADVAGARVASLSHGQRRRLDLARALLHRPAIVLLDEPATGLDDAGKRTLDERLASLAPELSVVAAPDDPGIDVDRVVRLLDGELVEGDR